MIDKGKAICERLIVRDGVLMEPVDYEEEIEEVSESKIEVNDDLVTPSNEEFNKNDLKQLDDINETTKEEKEQTELN